MNQLNSINNRLKFGRMCVFRVLVLWGVCHFCLQKHLIICMRVSNVPCMKNIMCILLNESVIS